MFIRNCSKRLRFTRCCEECDALSMMKTPLNQILRMSKSILARPTANVGPIVASRTNKSQTSLHSCQYLCTDTPREKLKDKDMFLNHHWVESFDDGSNLKKIVFAKSKQPSAIEIELEKRREEVSAWNRKFWKNHNADFFKQKKDFSVRVAEKAEGSKSEKDLSDEMSTFYKDFLDKNYRLHMDYNREWYKRNFGLLFLSLKASFMNLIKS